jgi:hypothetical protein
MSALVRAAVIFETPGSHFCHIQMNTMTTHVCVSLDRQNCLFADFMTAFDLEHNGCKAMGQSHMHFKPSPAT